MHCIQQDVAHFVSGAADLASGSLHMTAAAQALADGGYIDLIRRPHGNAKLAGFFFLHGNADLSAFDLERKSGDALQLCLIHLELPQKLLETQIRMHLSFR